MFYFILVFVIFIQEIDGVWSCNFCISLIHNATTCPSIFVSEIFHQSTKTHGLNPSCTAQNILQSGKILTKLLSFVFRIIRFQLFVLFNHCILILLTIYKINACKKTKNCPFVQTNISEMSLFLTRKTNLFKKLIPLS